MAIYVRLMQSGGPSYPVELGRLDGLSSTAASVNGKLPQPTFTLNQLTDMFAANGLTQTDMIALSGLITCHLDHLNFPNITCSNHNFFIFI